MCVQVCVWVCVDVWACGCVGGCVFSGTPPGFYGVNVGLLVVPVAPSPLTYVFLAISVMRQTDYTQALIYIRTAFSWLHPYICSRRLSHIRLYVRRTSLMMPHQPHCACLPYSLPSGGSRHLARMRAVV